MNPPQSPELRLQTAFSDWRELFTQYRNDGRLSKEDRAKFLALTKELMDSGCFERLPSLDGL